MVAMKVPVSSTPSRLTVVKPGNVNVIEYVPGRIAMQPGNTNVMYVR